MTAKRLAAEVLALLLLCAVSANAHPLAPSLLQLEEAANGLLTATWKTPQKSAPGSRLSPILPESCKPDGLPAPSIEATALVVTSTFRCGDLLNASFAVSGIASSKADVILKLTTADGRNFLKILTDEDPTFVVPSEQSSAGVARQYLALGIEHLLSGIDHVLFIVCLALLIGLRRPLVWAITSFTLGHSVTLTLAAIGYVRFPSNLAEILIALSIVLVAIECQKTTAEQPGIVARRPWGMTFLFGLLHGLGFAGALAEVGLPPADIPLALGCFNLGIEFGQLLVVLPIGAFLLAAARSPVTLPRILRRAPAYAVGTVGALWFWQRLEVLSLLGFA